jgi:GNAT superfamily N-acetyltransferase
MEGRLMEVRALRETEREECLALWQTVWPGDTEDYFRRYFEGDIEWLPYYTQVAVESGRIVSAVHICRRTVACGDFRLQMGGIANVATLPEFRGRGLNTACLRAAIGVMEADALDFSLLFTGISGYYAKQGYASVPRRRLRGILRGDRMPQPTNLTVRAARPEDLDQLFAVYTVYNATRPIAVQRTPAYWRDWIGLKPETLATADPLLVATDATGRVVGYICYRFNFYRGHQVTEDYAYISEFGAIAPGDRRATIDNRQFEDEVAMALLEAATARALASGKREMHLSIALTPSVRAAMRSLCESSSENVTESGMARLLHRENLLRSFLFEWNDRWIEAGRPPGEIVFDTPYGAVRLDAFGQFLKVEPVEARSGALSQGVLLSLLLGAGGAEQAVEDPEVLPLAQVLFPPRDGIYWSADGF